MVSSDGTPLRTSQQLISQTSCFELSASYIHIGTSDACTAKYFPINTFPTIFSSTHFTRAVLKLWFRMEPTRCLGCGKFFGTPGWVRLPPTSFPALRQLIPHSKNLICFVKDKFSTFARLELNESRVRPVTASGLVGRAFVRI